MIRFEREREDALADRIGSAILAITELDPLLKFGLELGATDLMILLRALQAKRERDNMVGDIHTMIERNAGHAIVKSAGRTTTVPFPTIKINPGLGSVTADIDMRGIAINE
jgi:hypothetical protein